MQLVKAELIYENERLNCYKDTLQLVVEYFDTLFWVVVLRAHNEESSTKENLASFIYPREGLVQNEKINIVSRYSMHALGNCQFFDDDMQIQNIMNNSAKFEID